jgi:hypothetical protein
MPSAAISFGNQQATGDSPLAGAPGLSYNVVVDGAGAVRRRPGIVAWDDFPGLAAYEASANFPFFTDLSVGAIASFQGKPVWTAGEIVYDGDRRFLDWWSLTEAGALDILSGSGLPTTGRPVFAETQFRIVVTAGGNTGDGSGLYWNGSAAFGSIWIPSGSSGVGPFATQIAALAQRLFTNDGFTASVNNRILYTGPGSAGNLTMGALSFTAAEARPDAVVALRENSNELFAFGGTTLQVFVPDPNIILAPQRAVNRGCSAAHSVIRADEHFAWFDDQRQFVVSDGREIDVPSDPIAETLDAIETVSDCYGFRVNQGQFDLLVWQFPTDGRTFAYQRNSGWSQWSTWDVDLGHGPFAITSHYYWPEQNLHLVGLEDGTIAQLSNSAYTDLGDQIVAEVTTGFINHSTDAVKFTDALHLTFKRGQSASTEPKVFLSWRDDLGAFGDPIQIGLGTTGDYVSTVTLRTLGGYRRRQWKLLFSADAELVLASVTEDYSIGGA